MIKKYYAVICLIIFLTLHCYRVHSQDVHTQQGVDCTRCHACEKPTSKNPCFKPCPRPFREKEAGKKLTLDEVPDFLVLDDLERLYEPVGFSHKLHADMANMSGGCVACHHFTPTNQSHPPCKECHDPINLHEDIKKPGLKGAYHRQCIQCHCEWSKDTDCEICHAFKEKKQTQGKDYKAPHYKPCKEPEKKLYETEYEQGAFVTFFHINHSKFYGFNCANCHQQDACVTCHYQKEKPVSTVDASTDIMHYKCSACHDIDTKSGCSKCHSKTKIMEFDHNQATGWALGVYHQPLGCECCHAKNKEWATPGKKCNDCHSAWNSENFRHSITGIALDETHALAECSDCHANRIFSATPVCSDCHEAEISYPNNKPGKVTKKGR